MSAALRFGLVASPVGATLAGLGGYFAAAKSCHAGQPDTARLAFLAIAAIGLILAAAGLASSLAAWRAAAPSEPPHGASDRETLSAFLARAGLLSSVVLVIGIAYLVLGPILLRACEKIW
jgi:hypothetical protein